MREKTFTGQIKQYSDYLTPIVEIGDRDVIEELTIFDGKEVIVTLWIEGKSDVDQSGGHLHTSIGFSGTDVTPYDPPEVIVGDENVLDRLFELDDGHQVALAVELIGEDEQ